MKKRALVRLGDQTIYALQPRQYECFAHTPLALGPDEPYPTHIGFGGSAGGGKSYLARAVAVFAAQAWPGSVTIIFRRTYPEVRDNHVFPFLKETLAIKDDPRFGYEFKKADNLVLWHNKSITIFGHLQHETDVFRYQGNQYDVMIFEEATHYTFSMVSWLTGNRLRSNVKGSRPFALYPSNPGNVGHAWYKRLFITRNYDSTAGEHPHAYAFVQSRVQDNAELLTRDPGYLDRLNSLPEPYRSQLRDGDFEAGAGLSLPELSYERHLIPTFTVPEHWTRFAAFDWGFNHPWAFMHFASDEDGTVYVLDSLTGRHQQAWEIADEIKAAAPAKKMTYMVAGTDLWHAHRARGEGGVQLADTFAEQGLYFIPATTDRVQGLAAMRAYVAYRGMGTNGMDGEPGVYFFDTPGNRAALDQLMSIPTDPKKPETPLKQDADELGRGGDDFMDACRYALVSRPKRAPLILGKGELSAWSPRVLEKEARRMTSLPKTMQERPSIITDFGEL